MGLEFELDPEITGELRDAVVGLWVSVTNAGGAVGFLPPVDDELVGPVADAALDAVTNGPDHLLAGFDDGRLVALLFITDNRFRLKGHWRVLRRVMVTPGSQGKGYGRALMREAERAGAGLGLEGLQVTVRGGTGTEAFYAKLGYFEVGRLPGAIRVAPGDDRDELIMWLPLDRPSETMPVR
jgi:GNAT superfamily N-acetyltransferase